MSQTDTYRKDNEIRSRRKGKSHMEVVYMLTDNLHPYLLPSIMSLLDHNEVDRIWIVTDKPFKYELPEQCKVIYADPRDYLAEGGPNWKSVWTPFAMLRVATAKIIPSYKVLQLDVDTIICDSIQGLWDTDIEDYHVAVVPEMKLQPKPFGEEYYNMGVALWNLKKLRKERIDDRMIDMLNTTPLPFPDQDVMNLLCTRKELNRRYNEMTTTITTDKPYIIHYAGYNPWWTVGVPRGEYYQKYKQYERF